MRSVFAATLAIALTACQSMPSQDTAKQQIAAVTQDWAAGMSAHDIDRVVALYDADAVLWGTRSPTIRANPQKVREYFGVLKTVPADYKAVINDQHIRVYGDIAVNSGSYTFSETRNGKPLVRPARFSMVYRYHDGQWRIIDHHSSAVPST
ncbi:MAG TPA: SgcJ/EcaC family oxidoreductase [Burkholderiales bacterium]|nr:SgcJ/EcaC family oxidoreductase [Burkholderiales bacterium]